MLAEAQNRTVEQLRPDVDSPDLHPQSRGASKEALGESQRHSWSVLHALWEERRRQAGIDDDLVRSIDTIFMPTGSGLSDKFGWDHYNNAELRVAAVLTESQIRAQYPLALSSAERRKVPELSELRSQLTPSPAEADPEAIRLAYLNVLIALQKDFIEKRSLRSIRSSIAARMLRYGIIAASLPVILLIILGLISETAVAGSAISIYPVDWVGQLLYILIISTLGMLGAYFSRMINFQTTIATISFENATNEYVDRVIRLRMLYGMIGAFIFFLVLKSGIFSADFLPKFTPATGGSLSVAGEASNLESFPSPNFAKLMICAFLAGFSERLVPDTLARIDQRAIAKDR